MKKLISVLCVAVLLVTALAGCSGKEYTIKTEDVGKYIFYDDPAGYELYGANDLSAAFVKYGPGGIEEEDYSHVLEIGFTYSTEEWRKGISSRKQVTLEEEIGIDFASNLTVKFVTMNDHPGIRIEDKRNGEVVEITYYLLVGEWCVQLTVNGYPENIKEADNDMETLIDSIRLDNLVFG